MHFIRTWRQKLICIVGTNYEAVALEFSLLNENRICHPDRSASGVEGPDSNPLPLGDRQQHTVVSDMRKQYAVYILASNSGTLYTGVSSDLPVRIVQHQTGIWEGFTSDYRVHKLVYCEWFEYVHDAIDREKQIKRWRREKKIALIEKHNPQWLDLSPTIR
jgi:putative endonuclease